MKKSIFVIAVVGLGLCLTSSPAWARQRSQSGSFQGSKGRSGTYERSASRESGQSNKSVTCTTDKGTGSRSAQSTWDKDSKTGTRSSSSTAANGKTRSSESNIVKNEDGSYTATGTATKADGQTVTSSRTVQKTDSGYSSTGTVTGANGKSITADKTVQKTDSGHSTSGSYSTNTGKSGAFGSNTTVTKGEFGEVNKNSYVTNQDGKTWEKTESKEKVGSTVFGDVSVVNPDGKEVVNRSSITTVDSNEK